METDNPVSDGDYACMIGTMYFKLYKEKFEYLYRQSID